MIKTTHVGSLPFLNTKDADVFNSKFDLPVLYTLPALDKNQLMLEQVVGNVKEFDKSILSRTIEVFNLHSIQNRSKFKYQMIGPVTLIKALDIRDDVIIEDILNWYLGQLKKLIGSKESKRCYFFLDEPMLFSASEKHYAYLNHFISELRGSFLKNWTSLL